MLNELIHLWNGKLMTSENYQNSQWFSEGFTEYLSNLILLESDEITLDQYIDKAEKIIGAYTYFSQRQYPEVSLVNAGINKGKYRFGVYNGGWVAALCFDLFLRNSPGNEKISIFDFFTTFFKKHKTAPYTLNDIMATLENLLNEPKDVFFKNYIYGSELLPFQNLLTDSGWKIAYIPFRSEAYLTKISFNSNWPIINQNNNVVWSYYFNDQYNRLKNLYKSNSISFDQNGFVKDGYCKLITALKNQHVKIDSLITTASILAQPKKQIFYEISTFWASNGKVYKQLVILTKTEGKIQRELEFIAESKLANIDIVEIDVQRAKWISLCNEHNSNELVDKMYTSNALYYNHKPMIIGKKGISKDYSYMNAQNYHLFLEPLVIEPVNEDLVYEIGQCKGSYNGKYILIWKREKNGYWKIFFDSNI